MKIITRKIFKTPECKFRFLENNGFFVPNYKILNTTDDILNYYNEYMSTIRDSLNYDIDGLVEEINDYAIQEDLGYQPNGLNPKFAKAMKFESLSNTTELLSIAYYTGATGRITPVANFKPVDIMGAKLSFASLHNIEMLEDFISKGLKIGSGISVIRAKDIIPQIASLTGENNKVTNDIELPTCCPACGGEIERNSVNLVCTNNNCSGKSKGLFVNYFNTLKIKKGAGIKFIEKAIEELNIKTINDLLNLTLADLKTLSGFGDKKAELTYSAIHSTKNITESQLIALLNIPSVGERLSTTILEYIPLEKLITLDFTKEEFIAIHGLQERTYDMVVAGIETNISNGVIESLLTNFTIEVVTKDAVVENDNITDKNFCITGKLNNVKRADIETSIRKMGGNITSVNKKLNYLVTNETVPKSSKFIKVLELNKETEIIKIITEDELIKMLEV